MTVDHEGKTPVCQQIAAIVRDRIESGRHTARPRGAGRSVYVAERVAGTHEIPRRTVAHRSVP